jgi:hypothetical protein
MGTIINKININKGEYKAIKHMTIIAVGLDNRSRMIIKRSKMIIKRSNE